MVMVAYDEPAAVYDWLASGDPLTPEGAAAAYASVVERTPAGGRVLCAGNALAHAVGQSGRRSALAAMAAVLAEGGLLAVTSRNWERLRAGRPGLDIADRLTYRTGRTGLAVRAWTVPDAWEAPHHVEVAVALLEGDRVSTVVRELLTFWPFTQHELDDDLRAAGLMPESATFTPDADHLVTAVRCPDPDLPD